MGRAKSPRIADIQEKRERGDKMRKSELRKLGKEAKRKSYRDAREGTEVAAVLEKQRRGEPLFSSERDLLNEYQRRWKPEEL